MKASNRERVEALERTLAGRLDGEVHFEKIYRAIYSTDASVYQIMPVGVAIPKTREDILAALDACREHGISITARGGGTSQAGQAIGAGLQLDFSKYCNRLLDIDVNEGTVRVEPGIILDQLNRELKSFGLHLPVDISTAAQATIGGMIANNAAGTRSIVYGKTLDYILELTVALSDGTVVSMGPLSALAVDAKCDRDDLEARCYRTVRRLGREHADEIALRFPKIMRRVGGYNLDEFVDPGDAFSLAKLMVGSEGTLGIVLEAKLKIVPLPKHRAVCAVQFERLLDAMAATPDILGYHPSAVELVDKSILDTTIGKTEFQPLRDFIRGDPGAVLLVEFLGDTSDELPARLDEFTDAIGKMSGVGHIHRATKTEAQARIWKLRKAALGLSMAQRGDAKSISFVEDTAVPTDRLHDYIERFIGILEKNETSAGFYAHASVGLLHVRPVVNMKTADGMAVFTRIAEQISDLVLEFGGALSGEHGDGLVRAPFQEKMYGPVLYEAFREVKRTFDPDGLLNPGKIVDAAPITENLRYGLRYPTRSIETAFDFSDFGGISGAAEQCGGLGDCRKAGNGTMCPSFMATRDERDSTRGRANALRLAISGQLGESGWADGELLPVLDLCLECKACKSECPTGVDMARLKSEFLHQYYRNRAVPLRSRLFSKTERLAVWGSRLAPVSNWLQRNRFSRSLNERLFRIDRRRVPPPFSRATFAHWWRSQGKREAAQDPGERGEMVLFVDTFTNFYEPEHGIAAVRIARGLGWDVKVPPRICCGRPLISKGLLDQAVVQARRTVEGLLPAAESGSAIVFCEPGCYSAVKDDHPQLLRGAWREKARRVSENSWTFEQWLDAAWEKSSRTGGDAPEVNFDKGGPKTILVHGHCHQKALVGMGPQLRSLERLSGVQVVDLDAGCCGMAGSFGYEREHYDISRACGERRLFPMVRAMEEDAMLVAPGFSCRQQIGHFTGVKPLSTMLLWDRYMRGSARRGDGL